MRITQQGATYDPILRGKEERTMIDFAKLDTSEKLHNFIRGMDEVLGAWTRIRVAGKSGGQCKKVRIFSSKRYHI